MQARPFVLALVFCACGARTPLDGSPPVDAATVDLAAVASDALAADSGDLDGPQLIGPGRDGGGDLSDVYVTPDVCIAPFDPYGPDSGGTCGTWMDCCQVKPLGASCQDGVCVGNHQQ